MGQRLWTGTTWQAQSLCRGIDPAVLFPQEGGSLSAAQRDELTAMCAACPVIRECDEDARATSASGWWAGGVRTNGRPQPLYRETVTRLLAAAELDEPPAEVLGPADPLVSLGFSAAQAVRARTIVLAITSAGWAMGDLMVEVCGPASGTSHNDGSYVKVAAIAVELACSPRFLSVCRAVASAWPPEKRRPGLSFALHRIMASDPTREAMIDNFTAWCERHGTRPTNGRFYGWLAIAEGRDLSPGYVRKLPRDVRAMVGPERDGLEAAIESFVEAAKRLGQVVALHPEARGKVQEAVVAVLDGFPPPALSA